MKTITVVELAHRAGITPRKVRTILRKELGKDHIKGRLWVFNTREGRRVIRIIDKYTH